MHKNTVRPRDGINTYILAIAAGFCVAVIGCTWATLDEQAVLATEITPIHREAIPVSEMTVSVMESAEPEVIIPPVSAEEIRVESEQILAEYEVDLPAEIREICEEAGSVYGICPELLEAIAWRESRYQTDAVNGDCTGIMQVSSRWHQDRMERIGATDLYNARDCIMTAADYLAELSREHSVATALMIYNGDARAREEGYVSQYAEDILIVSAALERAHGK
ncbi:MAG: transglycosylase SLT domain-containing protein [Eubacteriales bacterium]|nr:transglycosylase SLT domain-containing protein [Eubacteriales bacterium]